MTDPSTFAAEPTTDDSATGAAWAAILAGATGGFAFALLTVLSEVSATAGRLLQWYRPAGSLSGVAAGATLIWIAIWAVLHARWRGRVLRRQALLTVVTCGLVLGAMLGTFPPIYDLL